MEAKYKEESGEKQEFVDGTEVMRNQRKKRYF